MACLYYSLCLHKDRTTDGVVSGSQNHEWSLLSTAQTGTAAFFLFLPMERRRSSFFFFYLSLSLSPSASAKLLREASHICPRILCAQYRHWTVSAKKRLKTPILTKIYFHFLMKKCSFNIRFKHRRSFWSSFERLCYLSFNMRLNIVIIL